MEKSTFHLSEEQLYFIYIEREGNNLKNRCIFVRFCANIAHLDIVLNQRTNTQYYFMMKLFLIVLGFVGLCFAFLSVKLFFGQKFINMHIDGNKPLNAKGIHCVQSLDARERRINPHRVSERGDK